MIDAERQEFQACLALKYGLGSAARTRKKILDRYGMASLAVARPKVWLDQGLATATQVTVFLSDSWRENARVEMEAVLTAGMPVLTWSDPAYPALLRELPDAPPFLYYSGDLSLLDNPGVAVVGSRECSRYGVELAHGIARDLSGHGVTIISGMAYGIDREAHLGGLTGPGSSIAVLGTGLDMIYPASNRDIWRELSHKGLILSEFGPGSKPLGRNFPQRNRIISGLSLGVLVVEARAKSGSLITARLAMEQGREVFAVPGPVSLPSYRGCHEIINQGAKLVHDAEEILLEIRPQIEAFLKRARGGKAGPAPRPGAVRQSLLAAEEALPSGGPAAREPGEGGAGLAGNRRRARRTGSATKSGDGAPDGQNGRRRTDSVESETRRRAEDRKIACAKTGPAETKPCGRARMTRRAENAASRPAGAGIALPTETVGDEAAFPRAGGPSGAENLEDAVLAYLGAVGVSHVDALCQALDREAGEMSAALLVLEMKGVVARLPGMYYRLA